MPVHIYYKQTEEGSEVKHHSIDELFLPKVAAGSDIPESQLTGIKEINRDLAVFYEPYKKDWNFKSSEIIQEPSGIYIGDNQGSAFSDMYKVLGEQGKGELGYSFGTTGLNTHRRLEVPAKYRNRTMYWNQWQQLIHTYEGRYYWRSTGGGFIKPGTTHIDVYSTCWGWTLATQIQFHEVEVSQNKVYSNDIVNRYAAPDKIKTIPWYYMNTFTPRRGVEVHGPYNTYHVSGAPYYACTYDEHIQQLNNKTWYGSHRLNRIKPAGQTFFEVQGIANKSGFAVVCNIRATNHPKSTFTL